MNGGKLLGIATRVKSRVAMMESDAIEITPTAGCRGDFRGKPGNRQVTVLAREDWQAACEDLGQVYPWTSRRANLLIEGVRLFHTTGMRLSINDVVLEVTGETDPCRRMDEVAGGLRAALEPDWRGGVCCRVIRGGAIAVGDRVAVISDVGSATRRCESSSRRVLE